MRVSLRNAVEQMKNIKFQQPMIEAIVNSIEAEATNIDIELNLIAQNQLDEEVKMSINGFTITDNGVGFTPKNINSFKTYYSDYKKAYGCKGIGRITWLKVFQQVKIESYTGTQKVVIIFNEHYEDEVEVDENTSPKNTKVIFSIVKTHYTKEFTELKDLKQTILTELFVKLYLQSLNNKTIQINLDDGNGNHESITEQDLPTFSVHNFQILIKDKAYDFQLYYYFSRTLNNQHWLCADERIVLEIPKDIVPSPLPENTSSIFLLCSTYLNEQVKSERNEFDSLFTNGKKNGNDLVTPITLPTLLERLKSEIHDIILKKYPNLYKDNERTVEEFKNEYPYLSSYISCDQNKIYTKPELLSSAKKLFDKEKVAVSEQFQKLLEHKDFVTEDFINQSKKLTTIANQELAEYILYREQIILGLQRIEKEPEKVLHNLFMPMGSTSHKEQENTYLDSNLWLLDDKFMIFDDAFSDKSVKKIQDSFNIKTNAPNGNYEPDITVFYSDYSGKKDLVVIELKKPSAKSLEKVNAITELSRNIASISSEYEDIRRIYGYVITELDEQTQKDVKSQPGVLKLFTANNSPMYYIYNNNITDKNNNIIDCHLYILSIDAISQDASARNKTFLDILKNSENNKYEL